VVGGQRTFPAPQDSERSFMILKNLILPQDAFGASGFGSSFIAKRNGVRFPEFDNQINGRINPAKV
jgi:hypothetical protein